MILELGSTTYMVVPLIARGRVVGSIMLLSDERTYDEVDLDTAEKLARCIALAVDNVYMFRKMQSAQDQLVHSAKLAALGVILAGIAHEVNNPLAIIRGQLKCFEMDLTKAKNPALGLFKSYVEKIHRNIDRIVKIAQHSKDFSRQSAQQFSKVEIPELVDSSLTLFEQQFHLNEISIHKNFLEKDLAILGDFNRLEQVLINIFSNAQDAIQAHPRVGGGNIHITVDSIEDDCRISISDDGIGLSSTFKDRVFEPFFTTKDVGHGTGLGLSISHGIIKDHNGKIEFTSAHEKGTKIIIRLPLYQDPTLESITELFH
jgi:two-component system NtrC family sensor kinase